MHMRGTPQTMQDEPIYADVVAEVMSYLRDRRDALLAAGVAQDRIALDPGIGFGKTTAAQPATAGQRLAAPRPTSFSCEFVLEDFKGVEKP